MKGDNKRNLFKEVDNIKDDLLKVIEIQQAMYEDLRNRIDKIKERTDHMQERITGLLHEKLKSQFT